MKTLAKALCAALTSLFLVSGQAAFLLTAGPAPAPAERSMCEDCDCGQTMTCCVEPTRPGSLPVPAVPPREHNAGIATLLPISPSSLILLLPEPPGTMTAPSALSLRAPLPVPLFTRDCSFLI